VKYKLQKIDESLISEHSYLEPSDICFFFGEYASHKGYQHSPMNQLIFNLKKEIGRKEKPEWRHKEQAIKEIAELLVSLPNWEKTFKRCTWIPLPPSKKQTHQEYDDRLLRILEKTNVSGTGSKLDIREMLITKSDRPASHLPGIKRFTKEEHLKNLMLDEKLINPNPKAIVIFDDVITSGASFKAAQEILKKKFTNMPIAGVFIARALKYQ
jgi:predicted amidophosphoribosyltransferase